MCARTHAHTHTHTRTHAHTHTRAHRFRIESVALVENGSAGRNVTFQYAAGQHILRAVAADDGKVYVCSRKDNSVVQYAEPSKFRCGGGQLGAAAA